ncbi:60Kd inner membrane protein-domain-containing protein [Aspergillus cavernicola]|uniref:60Kd inner membrane protein-domain-containing protein n=1 Tax=Aspergillus cavernicola TaxID=176166 RepID=A0ABR4ILT4_9EURO
MKAVRGIPRIKPGQQVRRFHQTRPAPFINEVLEVSSSFVHGVHSVSHLPWALSLPLTAFLVRMGVALPLQFFTRVQARKDGDLAPILQSWRHYHQKHVQEKKPENGRPLLRSEATRLVSKQLQQQHQALRNRWGVYRYWKPVNFLQMPVWIMIMESIRGMSGNNRGLVPYLLSLFEPSSSSASNALHLAVEPSLATEGALWFPDLLAGDSTGILPMILTLSILLNVRMGWKATTLKSMADLPRLEMAKQLSWFALRVFVQALSLNIGVSSYLYQMPTALMIYWISSTNIATLQTFLLQKYMFPTPSLKPWRQVHIGYAPRRQTPVVQN